MNSQSVAHNELAKFLSLAVGREREAYMFSPAIDVVWHGLVRNGGRYHAFCAASGIEPLGHIEAMGRGAVAWVDEYHERFGELPDIWFRDASGSLNDVLHGEYLKTGKVHACWDCHPLPMPGVGGLKEKGNDPKKPASPPEKQKPSRPRR